MKFSEIPKLADRIEQILIENKGPMTLKQISKKINDKPQSTIRGRIYDNIGKRFKKVARGVYTFINDNSNVMVIEGDGRDLSTIEDNSIDCIITDHPWEDKKSNIGGTRKFTNEYSCFKYNINDLKEKARVLKEGSFLVEFLPDENENNYEYIYKIKQMAKEVGLKYYAKVPWKKGSFISNTGRKSKNREDIMIFTKGKARCLRPDVKKIKQGIKDAKMSGTTKMLPPEFDVQPANRKKKIHQAEKPVKLYELLIEYFTLPGEIILDQFSGSGNLGKAILNLGNRFGILIEQLNSNIKKIISNLNNVPILN